MTGNLAATFLGGYKLEFTINHIDCSNGTLQVKFFMFNESTMASLSHVPVVGYTEWWKENVGKPLNKTFASGPGSLKTQTATWTETLKFAANPQCGSKKPLGQPDVRPTTFTELDTNPARGAMERAKMLAEQAPVGKKSHSADESPSTLFDALLDILNRIDKGLTGDATQSIGLLLYAKGTDSKSSTATKPTKDVIYLNDSGWDLTDLLEVADVLSVALAKRSEMFTTWKKFKEGPAEVLFEFVMKVKEAKEQLEKDFGKDLDAAAAERLRDTATELLSKLRSLRVELAKIASLSTDKAKSVNAPTKEPASDKSTGPIPATKAPKIATVTAPAKDSAIKDFRPPINSGDSESLDYVTVIDGHWVQVRHYHLEFDDHVLDEIQLIQVEKYYADALVKYLKVAIVPRTGMKIGPHTTILHRKNFGEFFGKRFDAFYVDAGGGQYELYELSDFGTYAHTATHSKATSSKSYPVLPQRPDGFQYYEKEAPASVAKPTIQPIKTGSGKTITGKATQGKVQVGQWVAYDGSGNQYIMVKYSDRSKRFIFASIFGSKDIKDPGPMDWRRTQ
jgi:hypothetical protein